tara:strand:- start:587 stop:1102 length:516 start_codon:yes stop_codon:yes gene_type:complete
MSKKLRQQSSENWDVDDEGLLMARPTAKANASALMKSMQKKSKKKGRQRNQHTGFTFQCICPETSFDSISQVTIKTEKDISGVIFKLTNTFELRLEVWEDSVLTCSWTCEDLTPELTKKTLQTINYEWHDYDRLFYNLTFKNPYTGSTDDGYGPSAFEYDRFIYSNSWLCQ